jgi:hypothetical protein
MKFHEIIKSPENAISTPIVAQTTPTPHIHPIKSAFALFCMLIYPLWSLAGPCSGILLHLHSRLEHFFLAQASTTSSPTLPMLWPMLPHTMPIKCRGGTKIFIAFSTLVHDVLQTIVFIFENLLFDGFLERGVRLCLFLQNFISASLFGGYGVAIFSL